MDKSIMSLNFREQGPGFFKSLYILLIIIETI